MSNQNEKKRRNWTEDEDTSLLRQIAADQPFDADVGGITKAWDAMASTLSADESFGRIIDGRKAQNRFIYLVDHHKKFNTKSATLSGAAQDYTEKQQLLDELVQLLQAFKDKQDSIKMHDKEEKEVAEIGGNMIRDNAMRSLGKRKQRTDDESTSGTSDSKRDRLATAIDDDSERQRQLELKRLEIKQLKIEAQAKENADAREHQLTLAKLENERYETLLRLLLEKNNNK
jgi:hypothetical protein